MSKSNKVSTFILNSIIAFLLSIFLTMICYLCGIYFGMFQKNVIVTSMDHSRLYQNMNDSTLDIVKPLSIPFGVDETVFDHVLSVDETATQSKNILLSRLNHTDYTPDVSQMKDRLKANIYTYLKNHDLNTDAEQKDNIDKFVALVAAQYQYDLNIPYITYVIKYSNLFHKIMIIGIPFLLGLSIFAIFLIMKLNRMWHKGLRFIAYSTIATAIMTAGIPTFLLISRPYQNLNITPDYFKIFIIRYLDKSLSAFLIISYIMILVSALLITAIYNKMKKIQRRKKTN